MADPLSGMRIAFMVANFGVEQSELTVPWEALRRAGAAPVLVAPERGDVQAFHHDIEPADLFEADEAVNEISSDEFDALVLPGGTINPDKLRMEEDAVHFVHGFVESRKPIAATCHGPWSLVEADVVRGKSLTSWPSLQTDIRNAGGRWRDAPAFTCTAGGYLLVTGRNVEDLDTFAEATVAAFAAFAAI